MGIIEFLQSFSHPILDWTMRIITEFGDVLFYIALGATLFWCIDKKFAYKIMTTLLFSVAVNGGIKHFTNKNRPYQDGAKPILQETDGSSMPSGHSQNMLTASTFMVYEYRKINWVKWLFIVLSIIVPFSRMYLGQHYLEDVIVGMILGISIGVLGIILFEKFPDKEEYIGFVFYPIILVILILIPEHQVFVGAGAYFGLTVGYFLEKKYVKSTVKAPLWVQILKVAIGLGVSLLLLNGLKAVFALIGDYLFLVMIRYFLVAFWASLGAPYLFKLIFKKQLIYE